MKLINLIILSTLILRVVPVWDVDEEEWLGPPWMHAHIYN